MGIVQFLENIDHRCRAALRWENINILCHLNILEADLLQVPLQDLFSVGQAARRVRIVIAKGTVNQFVDEGILILNCQLADCRVNHRP